MRSCSIRSGVLAADNLSSWDILLTCVSTTTPSFTPKAFPRTTLAVFLPTPGRAINSFIFPGTSPPWCWHNSLQQAWIFLALERNSPMDRIEVSRSSSDACAKCRVVGNFSKRAGVTSLTFLSVHWALRMVAISSSNEFLWMSAHWGSGNSANKRLKIFFARPRLELRLSLGIGSWYHAGRKNFTGKSKQANGGRKSSPPTSGFFPLEAFFASYRFTFFPFTVKYFFKSILGG